MTSQNQKKQDKGKNRLNTMAAAITGAVIGAGVAVAGAVALRDEKNREKIKGAITGVEDKLVEGRDKVEKAVNSAKDSFNSK